MKLVECVPNFSEGRDEVKIKLIAGAAESVPGVIILDVEKDIDHNRTVLTFVADAGIAVEACFRAVKKASELIDLNFHKGEHPRMGAMDVAPFIPVMGSSAEDCVLLAKQLGEKIGRELNIPVYLYDLAAQRPDRKDLAKVRKGQFEGLKEEIGKNPDRVPDFGPNKIHPTAGAIAVGAREQIINFNVNLETTDMAFGAMLAKKIRTSGGGLPCLRAKEIFLESKNQVQISTVLTNYKVTSVQRVISEIEKEISPKGIKIANTELIGLTTQEALTGYSIEALKVQNFNPKVQILEGRLMEFISTWQAGANKFIDALSDTSPTPGGGSAGAIASSMGCALGMMAIGITLQSKKLEEGKKPLLRETLTKLSALKSELQACISEDARAFDMFMEVRKLPKDSPERVKKMQEALLYAAEVPLKTATLSKQAEGLVKSAESSVSAGVASDGKCSLYLLRAGILSAAENVKINIDSLHDKSLAEKLEKEISALVG
ncbi:MAG: glutamate formimidoyltransferase [Elusimicrobia bacterium]|nr:glutamate formimidoyltransferase [Elusimicrobiota bacterium]